MLREDRASATIVDSTAHIVAVNIFGGSEDGRVEYRSAGSRKWQEASKSERIAPEVVKVSDWNHSKTKAYRKAHKEEFIPMILRPSPHLWEITDSTSSHGSVVRIRYKDAHMKASMKVKLQR